MWNDLMEASCRAAGYLEAAAEHARRVWQPYCDVAHSVRWAREMIKLAEKALHDMENANLKEMCNEKADGIS